MAGLVVGRHQLLLALWAMLAVGAVILAVRAGPRLLEATSILNVVALGLVLINVATILQYEARARAAEHAAIHAGDAGFEGTLPDPGRVKLDQQRLPGRTTPPDIYYIILEEYGGEDGLREVFHFDNTPFLSFLESRGFYVAHQSTTNYPRTALSVASSLNMEYLDFLADQLGTDSDDTQPLTRLLQYSRVARFLKSIGYRYVQIGSWWLPTAQSPIADQNIVYGGLSEFSTVLYKTTVLQPLKEDDFRIREWKRAQFQFAALSKIPREKGPNFVFAHILLPHDPYVFNPDGSYVSGYRIVKRKRLRRAR